MHGQAKSGYQGTRGATKARCPLAGPVLIYRRYGHSCGTVRLGSRDSRRAAIVVGGLETEDGPSVEILNLETG